MKSCSKCGSVDADFYKDKNFKDGFRSICKSCDKLKATKWNKVNKEAHANHELKYRTLNPKQMKENKQKYVKENPASIKNSALKYTYGIGLEEFNLLKSQQNNCCAICATNEKDLDVKLCVDHCHKTGKIRGILCTRCNLALGFIKEDIEALQKAINYLKDSNEQDSPDR